MKPWKRHLGQAFSLVELLVVICIMAVLAVFAQMGLSSVSNSTKLSTSVQQVSDQLNMARQLAIAQNQYVQVRFFSPKGAGDPRSGQYSALGLYRSDSPFYGSELEYQARQSSGKFLGEGPIRKLPEGCAIAGNASLSKLIDWLKNDSGRMRKGTAKISGKDYDWVGFYFFPDGSMDVDFNQNNLNPKGLKLNEAYLTVGLANMLSANDAKLPANYGVIAFDPISGRLQVIRP